MFSLGKARTFNIGVLANEVEFCIGIYKNGGLKEEGKKCLLIGKEFLEDILNFEREKKNPEYARVRGALPKLELLEASGSVIDAWIQSEVPFPENDEDYENELNVFIKTLDDIAQEKQIEEIGNQNVDNVEKLFSTLGMMVLKEIHVSSLYDRT